MRCLHRTTGTGQPQPRHRPPSRPSTTAQVCLEPGETPLPFPTQPRGAPSQPILSIQSPATSQSGSLWRNPCIGGTLAGNYRVEQDYHVDYSPQEPHPSDPHPGNNPGGGGPAPHNPYDGGHHTNHRPSLVGHDHHSLATHHYAPAHHPHPILTTNPSHLGRHMGGPPQQQQQQQHYNAGPSPLTAPLYPSLAPASHPGASHTHALTHTPQQQGVKRPRPDDLDLSSVPGLTDLGHHSHSHSHGHDLDALQQQGTAYAQAAAVQTHHHHRLPDTGPPAKMMRRDGGGLGGGDGGGAGGAPSVVGQAGMPAPAARPRGPKLKFTPEDDQLLIDLKENKSLTWKQIADFFPGRTSGTLQVRYCTKLKAKTTQWSEETVSFFPFFGGGRRTVC